MEDFITTDKDRAYVDRVGDGYLSVVDIFTDEKIKISIDKSVEDFFRKEMSLGDTVFVVYDKEKKVLIEL